MQRIYTKVDNGVAPDGRWYAGDVNLLQDTVAALTDFAQIISVGQLRIGEAALGLTRFGAGEARLSGKLRVDGALRALGGLYIGAFSDALRDSTILPADRNFGTVILNVTRGRYEWNAGTDVVPLWYPLAVDVNGNLVMPPNGKIIFSTGIVLDGNKPPVSEIARGKNNSPTVITATSIGAAQLVVATSTGTGSLDGSTTVKVLGYCANVHIDSGGPGQVSFALYDNGNVVNVMSEGSMVQPFGYGPINLRAEVIPSPGDHVFSIHAFLTSVTQATVRAGLVSGVTYAPATINVER